MIRVAIHGGARVAQLWARSSPTNVARVQIPALTPYVGWVCCWFSPLLREVFLQVLRFSPLLLRPQQHLYKAEHIPIKLFLLHQRSDSVHKKPFPIIYLELNLCKRITLITQFRKTVQLLYDLLFLSFDGLEAHLLHGRFDSLRHMLPPGCPNLSLIFSSIPALTSSITCRCKLDCLPQQVIILPMKRKESIGFSWRETFFLLS